MRKILIILILVLIFITGCSLKSDDKIKIIKYEKGTINIIKEIDITSRKDIKDIKKYIDKIELVPADEMVDLALLNEIEIMYNDKIEIYIDLDSEDYCYYRNTDNKIYTLAYLSDEFLELINSIVGDL